MRRWHAELPLMERRYRFDLSVRGERWARPLGAQRKTAPLDCGCTGCSWCHPDKHDARGPARQNKRLKAITFDLGASG